MPNRCAAGTSRAIPFADYQRKYFGEQRILKRYQGFTTQETEHPSRCPIVLQTADVRGASNVRCAPEAAVPKRQLPRLEPPPNSNPASEFEPPPLTPHHLPALHA